MIGACGAAGSALPWHGRGRRFDPDQVHQFGAIWYQICIAKVISTPELYERGTSIWFRRSKHLKSGVDWFAFQSESYARQLRRFQYGPAAFKADYALSSPIPWTAKECSRAVTVHIGGSLEEIVAAERALDTDRPFVLLGQPSLFDASVLQRVDTLHGHIAMCRMVPRKTTPRPSRTRYLVSRRNSGTAFWRVLSRVHRLWSVGIRIS